MVAENEGTRKTHGRGEDEGMWKEKGEWGGGTGGESVERKTYEELARDINRRYSTKYAAKTGAEVVVSAAHTPAAAAFSGAATEAVTAAAAGHVGVLTSTVHIHTLCILLTFINVYATLTKRSI